MILTFKKLYLTEANEEEEQKQAKTCILSQEQIKKFNSLNTAKKIAWLRQELTAGRLNKEGCSFGSFPKWSDTFQSIFLNNVLTMGGQSDPDLKQLTLETNPTLAYVNNIKGTQIVLQKGSAREEAIKEVLNAIRDGKLSADEYTNSQNWTNKIASFVCDNSLAKIQKLLAITQSYHSGNISQATYEARVNFVLNTKEEKTLAEADTINSEQSKEEPQQEESPKTGENTEDDDDEEDEDEEDKKEESQPSKEVSFADITDDEVKAKKVTDTKNMIQAIMDKVKNGSWEKDIKTNSINPTASFADVITTILKPTETK